ncbi:MAG: SGNH/GDSL hydrolase family protein [Candidatus Saccharimonadales bacterium]
MRRMKLSIIVLGLLGGLMVVSAAQVMAKPPLSYVALGDSVAAGLGLSDTEGDTCGRSTAAYPHQVAAGLGTIVTQLACSGAKVDEGIYGPQTMADNTELAAQLSIAFADGTPDVMTVTVGANDARWTRSIKQCYVWKCGSRVESVAAKVYRADLRAELYNMLYQVYRRSDGDPPKVLLSGYYAPIGDATCSDTNRLSASERTWIKQQTADLNQAIKSVIPYFSYAQYVPVSFSGHELCTTTPWVQSLDDPAPFHPTAEGQTAIARAFLSQLR